MIDRLISTKGDRILFLSGGPKTHLATKNLFASDLNYRVIIRQPEISPQRTHSPLNGETILDSNKPDFNVELQNKIGDRWETIESFTESKLNQLFRKLIPHTPFGSKWAGALAYDLVQWTQPIKLQYPPQKDSVLGILWLVDEWIEGDCVIPEIDNSQRVEDETTSHSDDEHAKIVSQIRSSINAGELYQLNFGRTWNGSLQEDPATIFHRLAISNPAPFSGYIEASDLGIALASSSPEILLQTEGKHVMTAPIKGTRPRGADVDQEALLRQELVYDKKERAEHRMLVDLERNDLSIVCEPGTVKQTRFDVEAYSNVQHLVSQISGTLKHDCDGMDALQALFPGGSITGCPKTVVCAAIDELEGKPRSFWTGSMGWIDVHSGDSTWNIMIRSLEARKQDNVWQGNVMAGGGIPIDSNPNSEVAEATWKASALRRACSWLKADSVSVPQGDLGIYPLYLEQKLPEVLNKFDLKVAFIDNLDSFSYNIIHYLEILGCKVEVIDGRGPIRDFNHDAVIIGPGPGRPEISPISLHAANLEIPTLGICLGHQAIGITRGMDLIESPFGPVHGVPSEIHSSGLGLIDEGKHLMTRYNSLVLSGNGDLDITSTDETGTLPMEIKDGNTFGIQFHPESIGSENGIEILRRFLHIVAHS